MSDYAIIWCEQGHDHRVDGLALDSAHRAMARIIQHCRPQLDWVCIRRDGTIYAYTDRAQLADQQRMSEAVGRIPRNIGGELAPEDQA